MKKLVLAIVMIGFLALPALSGEPKKDKGWGDGKADTAVRTDLVPSEGDDSVTYDRKAKRLTWRQKRELGLTRGNIIRTARQMHKDGELDLDDPDGLVNQVVEEIMSENPQAYEDLEAVDWDAIFAFLEKLLPLLIMLFGGS
jgi:hypothetical protein